MNGTTRQRYLLYALGVLALIALWHYLGPVLGFGGDDEAAGGKSGPKVGPKSTVPELVNRPQ